jgi:hypothetical protein
MRQNCWQKQSLNLQADEIPRRPKGSVGMTNGGGGARTRGWFGHSTRTSHLPAPAAAGAQFCWQNCWQNCLQKQSLHLQADEIPRRPKGSVGMTSRGGVAPVGSPILLAKLLAEAIP